MDVQLNFINRANIVNHLPIVITMGCGEYITPVAWRVIENCGKGENHPFVVPADITIATLNDEFGNFTPQVVAQPGQQYTHALDDNGYDTLTLTGKAETPDGIDIVNALPSGTISPKIYRDGLLLGYGAAMAPGETVTVANEMTGKKTLTIVPMQVEQGGWIGSANLQFDFCFVSIDGVKSADLVKIDTEIPPPVFTFSLENVEG